ncbi:YcxB family protein [Rhizobium halophytocola]|uniref:YcxB-like C-terminal domain-containing protein n=1 Tax=Rhizobium halophytocola TaxID=735519 RepID=A0ABS4E3T5_9HYPH|nr:YcxB family protein [Rhizobium halophytocola]MBP1852603.1 hypothetical protein [Rhizobium halophytocola]
MRYRLTEDDILAGQDLWRRQRTTPVAVAMAFVFCAGLCAVYLLLLFELSFVSTAIASPLFAALVLFAVARAGRRLGRRKSVQYFRETPASHEETELTFDAAEISLTRDRGHGRHAWTDFKSWSEDATVFVLFPAGPQFFAFPKRAFSPADERAFRRCLNQSGLVSARLFPI